MSWGKMMKNVQGYSRNNYLECIGNHFYDSPSINPKLL